MNAHNRCFSKKIIWKPLEKQNPSKSSSSHIRIKRLKGIMGKAYREVKTSSHFQISMLRSIYRCPDPNIDTQIQISMPRSKYRCSDPNIDAQIQISMLRSKYRYPDLYPDPILTPGFSDSVFAYAPEFQLRFSSILAYLAGRSELNSIILAYFHIRNSDSGIFSLS